jgi:protein associated with RNAse G/E
MAKITQSKTSKYGNKKIELDGVKFDSKLELFCYQQFKSLGLEFDFQRTILLQEGFRFRGKAIRPITMIVDFVLHQDGQKIYIDTKGFATETSKLKYKMLKFYVREDSTADVVWLHSQKEVKEFINDLLSKDGKL